MAPKSRSDRKSGKAKAQEAMHDVEPVEVEHKTNGKVYNIDALKAWDGLEPDRNLITKACARKLGFSTRGNPGQTTIVIKLIWSLPNMPNGTTYDDDEFVIVDSASHEIVFGRAVSTRNVFERQATPGLAVVVHRITYYPPMATSLALSAAA